MGTWKVRRWSFNWTRVRLRCKMYTTKLRNGLRLLAKIWTHSSLSKCRPDAEVRQIRARAASRARHGCVLCVQGQAVQQGRQFRFLSATRLRLKRCAFVFGK